MSELEGICTWCAIRGLQFASCIRRAPRQADANKVAIDQLSLRVDALSKNVDKVDGLDVKISGLRTDVQSLMSRKHTQVARLDAPSNRVKAVESWKQDATSQLSQSVTSSRFDAFVAIRFADTEKPAHGALSRSTFDEWPKPRYEPVEHKANHAVLESKFDGYVALMHVAGHKPAARDHDMAPVRSTGASRVASELDNDDGGAVALSQAERGTSDHECRTAQCAILTTSPRSPNDGNEPRSSGVIVIVTAAVDATVHFDPRGRGIRIHAAAIRVAVVTVATGYTGPVG